MIITAIAPAFAAQPPVSATTATHNELEVVNETGSELSCVVAARREGHMPALPIPITSNVLTSPRASDVFIQKHIEPGKTFTIINLQDNESVMVAGQPLSVGHARLQNNRCVIKVSRKLFGYGAISISEPTCVELGAGEIDVQGFAVLGLTSHDLSQEATRLLQLPDSEAYKVLGVPQGASKLEIDEAFRNLMDKWQPYRVKLPYEKERVIQVQRKIKAAHAFMIAALNK